MKGAGGTTGGVGSFLAGAAMVVAGAYLLLSRVSVMGNSWEIYGQNAFGLSLVPLMVGIGVLFYNGKSVAGWLLTGAGAVIILAGIIANMRIYMRATSLFDTLMMLGLLAGGLGLVVRSLRAMPPDSGGSRGRR